MFRRLYETRFRSVILFGIIASAALAIAWAAISVAQTARGSSSVDYVQQPDGSILATGGIYSHWFDPIQDGMFMDSSSEGGLFGIGRRDHTCIDEGYNTPYECARGYYTQLQTGDGSSVDTQRHGMVFKKVSDNYYELNFPSLLYLYSHPNAGSIRCGVGLEFDGRSNQARLVGVPRNDTISASDCASEINRMAENWRGHGVPTLPTAATIRGASQGSTNENVLVRNEQDVYRGVWIPSCIANTTSSSAIERMNACIEQRQKGLAQLSNACSMGGASAAECSRVHSCLSSGGNAKSVQSCETEDPATSGERAQRWLNDDFSQDQNMATVSSDTIEVVCGTLDNVRDQRQCEENALAAKTIATTPEQPDPEEGEEAETSCAIEGVGWLLCPSLNFLANIADRAYAFLADSFLVIETELINTESSGNTGTFDAWRSMLGIANATFIIFFLFIIYSQITGAGLSNYNLKKMLPRLIVAAILVNVSFYICQIAVDLSNILGRGIEQLFASLGNQMNVSPPGTIDSTADWSSSSNWVGTTITVLAGGVAIYLAMPFLAGGLLVGVVALLTVGFLLIARKALIVLLIVIAPLAFVAFLLPNTEKWFNKWRSLFASMLLMFPVVSLLFGAGKLAGGILGSAAGSDVIMQIVSQVVVVIPLFAVWGVMRKSMEAAGAIGAKINGIGTKMQGSAKSAGNKAYENSRIGQFKRYRSQEAAKRRSLIQAGAYKGSGKNPLNWQRNIRSGLNRGVNKIIPGRFGTRSAAAGIALANKEDATLIEQEMALMASTADPKTQLTEAASILESASKSGDVVRARAAQKILLNSGAPGLDTLHTTLSGLESSGGLSNKMSSVLRSDIQSAGIKGKDNVLNNWTYDKKSRSIAELELSADPYDGLNPVELAGQSAKNLNLGVANSLITPQAAQQVLQSEQASGLLSAEKRKIFTNLAQNPQPRRAAGGSVAAPQAAPRTPVQPQAPQPVPPVAPNNQPAQNQARAGQAPAGTGGTPQQPTATPNLNNRQAQAKAKLNAAAQGTAGTKPFFVTGDGTTATSAPLATGSVKQAEAAQGTSGAETRVFSVGSSGDTTEQTNASSAGSTTDETGRQAPKTISPEDIERYHEKMRQ